MGSARLLVLMGALTLIVGLQPADLTARAFPWRPLRLILPFPPGGAGDLIARALVDPLGKNLGQPVLVINRDGGGTIVGMNEAAHANPDGYTLLLAGDSAIVNTASGRKLPYDLFKDLRPLALAYYSSQTMMVRRASPYNSLQDLVKAGRGGSTKFGSSGVGGAGHLAGELFNQAVG